MTIPNSTAHQLDDSPSSDADENEKIRGRNLQPLFALLMECTPGRVLTSELIEACGYPDLKNENSTGRRNFYSAREYLRAFGISIDPIDAQTGARAHGDARWKVTSVEPIQRVALSSHEESMLKRADALSEHSTNHVLARLTTAVLRKHPVSFSYRSRDRSVDPVSVVTYGRHAYLDAWDRTAKERRTFRVDRIDGQTVAIDRAASHRRTFAGPPAIHPSTWSVDASTVAVVTFTSRPTDEMLDLLGPLREELTDTPLPTFQFTTTNHRHFARTLLVLGPAAQLQQPSELVEVIRAELRVHLSRAHATTPFE